MIKPAPYKCDYCRKLFRLPPSKYKANKSHCCSRACANNLRRDKAKDERVPRHGTLNEYIRWGCRCVLCAGRRKDYDDARLGRHVDQYGSDRVRLRRALRKEYIRTCKTGNPTYQWTAEEAAKIADLPLSVVRQHDNARSTRERGELVWHETEDILFYEEN